MKMGRLSDLRNSRPRLFQLLAAAAVIAAALLIVAVMQATRQEVVRQKARIMVPVVSVMKADLSERKIILTSEGTVKPLRSIGLVPQVGGKVIYVSPALVGGGQFEKGEVLLRIDPIDYELAVKSAEAKVSDLESALQLTVESAEAAREEWVLSREKGDDQEPPPLVAKQPQLAAARAALAAGQADLEKAKLNLERATIRAPFKGRISDKSVDTGQFVPAGMTLGSMFSTDVAEIVLPMPDEDLYWFSVPGFTPGSEEGSPAKVKASIAGRELSWEGRVMRAGGILDPQTRMIDVVVRVDDPYGTKPPLAMGLFATVEIEGRAIENSLLVPRTAIHEGDTVWIVDPEGRLRLRKVTIARFEGDDVMITGGVADGESIVTSSLKIVTDGMKVNVQKKKGSQE